MQHLHTSALIVCKVGQLGRLVLPEAVRQILQLRTGDAVEFLISGSAEVLVRKWIPFCTFCGQSDPRALLPFHGHRVCRACWGEATRLSEKPPT